MCNLPKGFWMSAEGSIPAATYLGGFTFSAMGC